jgi:3-oxoacyl-[acyl-carrier-protein] synthase-3
MGTRSAGIIGTGSCLPDRVMTNFDLEKMVDTSDEWIVSRTGIKTRHIAEKGTATSDLAVIAARRALESAGLVPEDIDMIIVATYTPDTPLPSTAAFVQRELGAGAAVAFDIAGACTGFIYALAVANQFITTGAYRTALIIGAETCSRFIDWTDRNTCVLLGDGAGAVVLTQAPEGRGILSTDLGTDGTGAEFLTIPAGGSRMPPSEETVRNKLHFLTMNGKEIFKFGIKIVSKTLETALSRCNLTKEDIKLLVPHQANIRILKSAMENLSFPMEKVMVNLDRYGNTSAASIPIALDEAFRENRVEDGDVVALVGFGSGLSWGTVIFRK